MNVYKQRVLNIARALRESPEPHRFTMTAYSRCRTPACALGHYASRADLQAEFYLGFGDGEGVMSDGRYCIQSGLACNSTMIQGHFGINQAEAFALFNTHGCGNANTAAEAADYLERFARVKWPEPRRTNSALVSDLMAKVMGERIPEDA